MRKLIWQSIVAVTLIVVLAACSTEEEQGYHDYDPSNYDITLVNTDQQAVDVLTESDKTLYLYFTGVG